MNNKKLGNIGINNESRLPFSQACENNKYAILKGLKKELGGYSRVLEVGSGTGQHSVYFAAHLPHLLWQTSDVSANHHIIQAWHEAYPSPNLQAPLKFDLTIDSIISSEEGKAYDAVFTANTLHIIAWSLVQRLFELVGKALCYNSKFIIYGPFNENGFYTSASNQSFDLSLRQRDPNSGIRNKEEIISLAKKHFLVLDCEYQMPANNQILVFKKSKSLDFVE